MTTDELVREVRSRLPRHYQTKYKYWELKMVLEFIVEVIVESIALGESVKIIRLGTFSPEIRRCTNNLSDGKTYETIKVVFKSSKQYFNQAIKDTIGTGKIRCDHMDKFGYEQELEERGVKKAAKEGVCPVCGKPTIGNPPICPDHGSKPFEKRDHERKG